MRNKLSSIILLIATLVFILTFSIGLPIYIRPFYYVQVDLLDIEEFSGYDRETIIEASDDILDYLTIPGKDFSCGGLAYTNDGKLHFEDCKMLFSINAISFFVSVGVIISFLLLHRKNSDIEYKLGKFSPQFWASVGLLGILIMLLVSVLIDFDSTFEAFHRLFFYGKDNWIFDPRYDEIIMILPEEFFMNSAILIIMSVIIISILIIFIEVKKNKRVKNEY